MAGFGEMQMVKNVAEKLKGKSDEELVAEIRKLKAVMASDGDKMKKQLESMKPLREMLDAEQKSKFDMIVKVLAED